jgi:hypothetical protein
MRRQEFAYSDHGYARSHRQAHQQSRAEKDDSRAQLVPFCSKNADEVLRAAGAGAAVLLFLSTTSWLDLVDAKRVSIGYAASHLSCLGLAAAHVPVRICLANVFTTC